MLLVPPGVVTVTFLAVIAALTEIVKVAVTVVSSTTARLLTVTPDPDTTTLVPVPVKFVPVSVTGTAVPRKPELGAAEISVGKGGRTTVKVTALLVPLTELVIFTVLVVSPALAVMEKVAVTVVSSTTVILLTLTPLPETVIPLAPVKPLPVNVTEALVPRSPVLGAMEVSNGPCTLNVCALLVPLDVVTLTFRALIVALAAMVKVAVIVVEFTTVRLPTVTPVPDTRTLVPVAAKFAPLSVTGTAVPRVPLLGAMETNVGAGAVV